MQRLVKKEKERSIKNKIKKGRETKAKKKKIGSCRRLTCLSFFGQVKLVFVKIYIYLFFSLIIL
jgi:hypothetical protein